MLKNKKLLIIGANPETAPLIRTAKKMGVYTLVTDNNPNAAAKQLADKPCNIDGMDVDGLVELAKNESVNGVMVGVADRLIVPYQQVCEYLKLPCYCTKKQCEVLTDKEKFNALCEQYRIPTIPGFRLSKELQADEINNISYPVFVKPVDGNSGKGMTVCYKKEELKPAIDKALMHSKTKRFIVDKYMDCDDMFVYYTFIDGNVHLSATADRYTSNEQGNFSRVCLGGTYPSKHLDLYYQTTHGKLCKLFKDLEIRNGVLMISAFVEDGKLLLYDPGFRLQGEAPNLLIEAINGFDQREMLINFAINGEMGVENMSKINDPSFGEKHAATVWFLLKKGTIGEIHGLQSQTHNNVIKVLQRFDVGAEVTEEMVGTEAQVLARLYVVANSKEELKTNIRNIQAEIRVYDTNGDSMLLKGFEPFV